MVCTYAYAVDILEENTDTNVPNIYYPYFDIR